MLRRGAFGFFHNDFQLNDQELRPPSNLRSLVKLTKYVKSLEANVVQPIGIGRT